MPDLGISIGLDIDDKSVKFVKIKQTNGEIVLQKYAVLEIPPSEDKIKTVSSIIKKLFQGEKSDAEVYTCAYGANVSLKRISIPVIPDSEIPEALKWEAKNIVPFPIENSKIDFFKIGKITEGSTEKYDLMFAVASDEHIKFLSEISKESGVKFTGISLVPFALSSLLDSIKKLSPDQVNAIIDIGAEAASINLYKGKLLNFTREITVAGESITKAMTGLLVADHWQLNLSYEQAEEVKKKYGIPEKDTTERTDNGIPLIHIFEMMSPTLRRLQNEILRSFDYYKEEFREEKIDRIFLTGGSSCLNNLEDYLTNGLGIKVETIDPIEGIKVEENSGIDLTSLKAISGRLSLALGLALDRATKINLYKKESTARAKFKLDINDLMKQFNIKIPENFPIKIKMPANISIWIAVTVIAAAISYDVYLIGIRNRVRGDLSSKQLLLQDVKQLAEKRALFDKISKEETHVRDVLSQVSGTLPQGITLTDLSYNNGTKSVQLMGIADFTSTVGQLIKSFEDSPNFRRTTLIEARKAVLNGAAKIIFKVSFIVS